MTLTADHKRQIDELYSLVTRAVADYENTPTGSDAPGGAAKSPEAFYLSAEQQKHNTHTGSDDTPSLPTGFTMSEPIYAKGKQ